MTVCVAIRLVLLLALVGSSTLARAYDGLVEKKTFTLASYTTTGGRTIKDVRIGYETYGNLAPGRDNVVLITHFFSGNSHAAGKYQATDAAPGYWDAIIGSGKAIDTDRFFVVSSDTLVNLNVKDPNTVTTGPASIDPDTGKPYGMTFPIVTMRDFVNVQKALLDSLGIGRLRAVAGASMGALQALEWAAAYPEMVERAIPVLPAGELPAFAIGWANVWAAPIRLDPRWNGGDYYGRAEPVDGLAEALKIVTLHARHYGWATKTFGRKWAAPDRDPAKGWDNQFAIEETLDRVARARAQTADANSFLYLVKANQLFVAGHKGTLEDGLRDVKAKLLLLPAQSDLLLFPDYAREVRDVLQRQGKTVEYAEIPGDGGHLDGVVAVGQVAETIRKFLAE
jgi:homoserine O-acetyltransferase/O-succinyltransferase